MMDHKSFLEQITKLYELAKGPGHKHRSSSIDKNNNVNTLLPHEVMVKSGDRTWSVLRGSIVTFYQKPRMHGTTAICTIFDYEGQKQVTVYPFKVSVQRIVGQPLPQFAPRF